MGVSYSGLTNESPGPTCSYTKLNLHFWRFLEPFPIYKPTFACEEFGCRDWTVGKKIRVMHTVRGDICHTLPRVGLSKILESNGVWCFCLCFLYIQHRDRPLKGARERDMDRFFENRATKKKWLLDTWYGPAGCLSLRRNYIRSAWEIDKTWMSRWLCCQDSTGCISPKKHMLNDTSRYLADLHPGYFKQKSRWFRSATRTHRKEFDGPKQLAKNFI